jgi:hypothetical protein
VCSGNGEVATDGGAEEFIDGSGALVPPSGDSGPLQHEVSVGGEVRPSRVKGGGGGAKRKDGRWCQPVWKNGARGSSGVVTGVA